MTQPPPARENGTLEQFVADGRRSTTIAVEGGDAAAVMAAVHELRLGAWVNTSYPRGLAAVIEDRSARYAVIDVETNSIKFHLAERAPGSRWRVLEDRAGIDRQIELCRSRDADARRAIVGLQPGRAKVILAGACIARTIMEEPGQDRFAVSDRGLGHGVLAERFGTQIAGSRRTTDTKD